MVTVTNHKKSGRFSTSRNSSDSTNGYDTTITIPVVLNSTVYVNAAIVATLSDSISLQLFRGKDYSKLPYGNHGVDTFTAEKYAVQFMKLEKRVFGTNSFLLTDHNLFSYLLTNNNGKTASLISPSSFDVTMSSGECVDMINILYNNPDMIVQDGIATCIGFENGGGVIDTHMPPVLITGSGSTGGSGGAPTNPVGGGNNNNGLGWVAVDNEVDTPCDPSIADFQNDANFAAKFKYIASKAGDSKEYTYQVNDRVNNNYEYLVGQNWQTSMPLNVIPNFTKLDGVIHCHFLNGNSVFSPDDMILMAELFIKGYVRDTTNLFFGLATQYGSPLLIKVSNTQKFRQFALAIGGDGDEKKQNKFKEKYNPKLSKNSVLDNEVEFLKMLGDFKVGDGLKLYEGNSDCNQWSRLILNAWGDNVKDPIPCF